MRLAVPHPVAAAVACATLFLCAFSSALAEDVVYIFGKRGAIEPLRGTILQYEPGGSLHFRTLDGEEHVFTRGEIANVVRNATPGNQVGVKRDPKRYQRRKLPISFYGWVGYGSQSLSDLNRVIEEDQELLQGLGLDVQFDTFGAAPDYGVGLSFLPTRNLSIGMEGGYQTSTSLFAFVDEEALISNAIELRVIEITGAVEYRLPVANVLVGATAGVGLGNAEQRSSFRDFANPANDDDATSDWDGTGFVGGAYVGYDHAVSHRTALFVRSGYRSRNLGRFTGQTRSTLDGNGPTEPVDNDGNRLDFDFSGAYVRLGVNFVVGR